MYKKQYRKAVCFSLRRVIAVFLATVIVFCLLPYSQPVNAADGDDDENTILIRTYDELKTQALFTTSDGGNKSFEGKTLKLIANIDVPEITEDSTDSDIAYATCIFGSEENPFKGTFDGNGYTIKGLYFHVTDTNLPEADTGLFAATDGAVIKNLTIDSADIESDVRGGIVVGYANNTLIDNVTVKNSSLSVEAADNVLLIGTDLGICGGGIAGQVNESVLYNCEVNNCWIRTNNTAGIAALAGKPLTLGGIVGCAEGSTIEYCRVIGTTPYDENAPSGVSAANSSTGKTRLSIHYDVAVGAIGGNTLYVGGIAGRIWSNDNGDGDKGTSIIDCFSTAEMYYYCATYISVLGINVGHIGGIAAEVWDDNCTITRCHYAGRGTSYQYNAIAVIPIIQHDVNVSGVADVWRGNADKARENIYGSFFRDSINASNKKTMTTLGDRYSGEISSNGNFGPWSDNLYITRSAWEDFGFDFTGTVQRTSDYDTMSGNASGSHVNRWTIDYGLGCPVHGYSVAATLDFPNSGKVSIDSTDLVTEKVSTTDPYSFAVQGVYANEDVITLVYEPENSNYRLYGWYRIPNVLEDTAPKSQSYFDNLYDTYAVIENVPVYGADGVKIREETVINPVSKDNTYTAQNTDNYPIEWQDNDLFVARIQTLVEFYNYNGNLVDTNDGSSKAVTDDSDWYFYEAELPEVNPADAPSEEGTILVGWTTKVPDGYGDNYTYDVDIYKLQDLKQDGAFYEAGDIITEPLVLYPVYMSLAANAITQFEGYMYDQFGNPVAEAEQRANTRPGVGETSVTVDLTNGGENAIVTLNVTGFGTDGKFPDGYRFLGWYEDGHLVSTDENAILEGVNLFEVHTYVARFEYAVYYNVKCGHYGIDIDSEYIEEGCYATIWHTFEEPIQQILGPNFTNEKFDHWCTDDYQGEVPVTSEDIVRIPTEVFSNNQKYKVSVALDITTLIDFPLAGTAIDEYDGEVLEFLTNKRITATANEGYNFVGWSLEDYDEIHKYMNCGLEEKIVLDGIHGDIIHQPTIYSMNLVYMGHFTADIDFYDISGNLKKKVTRHYQQKVLDTDGTYTYPYYVNKSENTTVTHSYSASPTEEEMQDSEYVFIGWVNGDGLVNGDGTLTDEGKYIWDKYDETQKFVTSNPKAAAPYLVKENVLVYSTMDIYPVYAKCDVKYTTNFELAGIEATSIYNVPALPEESARVYNNEGFTCDITFTASNNSTTVLVNDASEGYYTISSIELIDNDTEQVTVLTGGSEGTYTVPGLKLGGSYTVVANYGPMLVVYHKGGSDGDELGYSKCEENSLLGKNLTPLNTAERVGDGYVLLGWTTAEPSSSDPFNRVNKADELPLVYDSTMVTQPMELWPVYIKTVAVNSNIDSYLSNPSSVRSLIIPNINIASGTLTAQDNVTGTNGTYYVFKGWYKGYVSDTTPGDEVTKNNSFTISGSDIYDSNVTYTAVYEIAYRVNYHGDETGDVVYTVMVPKSDPRSFVTTVSIPDENGALKEVTVPIDSEAFTAVSDYLDNNQVFREWQYIDGTGTAKRWDDFCNDTISSDMDLYPVAFTVTVEAEDNTALVTSYREITSAERINQDKLDVKVGLSTISEDTGSSISSVSLLVMSEYKQKTISVSIQENAYSENDTVSTAVEGIPVTLNLRKNADLDQSDSEASWEYGRKATDDEGKAVFVLTGNLDIEKKVENSESTNDDVFILKVNIGSQEEQLIPIKEDAEIQFTEIPYGDSWSVEEDMDWAWKYSNNDSTSSGQITSYSNTATVSFTNEKLSTSWLEGKDYANNVFGAGASGGGSD